MILLLFFGQELLNPESPGRSYGKEQIQPHRGWRRREEKQMCLNLSRAFFLALIGRGLFFHFFSVSLPPGTPISSSAFWKVFPATPGQNASSFLWPNSSFDCPTLYNTCFTSTRCGMQDPGLFLFCMYIHVISGLATESGKMWILIPALPLISCKLVFQASL